MYDPIIRWGCLQTRRCIEEMRGRSTAPGSALGLVEVSRPYAPSLTTIVAWLAGVERAVHARGGGE